MSELFDDEDKAVVAEDDVVAEAEKILTDTAHKTVADARRRLESLMEEKRLRSELEDFPED